MVQAKAPGWGTDDGRWYESEEGMGEISLLGGVRVIVEFTQDTTGEKEKE